MDPVIRVREFLLDNVGHMVRPGRSSYDQAAQCWYVPVLYRTQRGEIVVGDVELDRDGRIVFAPSREDMLARIASSAPRETP